MQFLVRLILDSAKEFGRGLSENCAVFLRLNCAVFGRNFVPSAKFASPPKRLLRASRCPGAGVFLLCFFKIDSAIFEPLNKKRVRAGLQIIAFATDVCIHPHKFCMHCINCA